VSWLSSSSSSSLSSDALSACPLACVPACLSIYVNVCNVCFIHSPVSPSLAPSLPPSLPLSGLITRDSPSASPRSHDRLSDTSYDDHHGLPTKRNRYAVIALFCTLALICVLVIVGVVQEQKSNEMPDDEDSVPEPPSAEEIDTCVRQYRERFVPLFAGNGGASRILYPDKASSILIRHANVYDGKDSLLLDYDILVQDGKISLIQQGIQVDDVEVYDAEGRYVTPGLVDMHSHAGVYAFPEIWATADGNEMTNPVFPQVRVIDAFNPNDWAIPLIRAGGVTTAQVLPGSGNIMGGEGGIFKYRGSSVEDMFVANSTRLLKMACGENPKRVYGRHGQTPMSRMGSAWMMREKFDAVRNLKERQESWCSESLAAKAAGTAAPASMFPHDLALEPLVNLFRKEARLHIHCYMVQDLEMILRLSDEFGFQVSAFHHALEAYKLPAQMKKAGVTIATFSDLWGYKYEAYEASVHAPKILHDAGVPVAMKSDHPVLNAATLMYEGAKAHYYGLDAMAAIRSVTAVPANAIGMGERVGTLDIGKDADIVVWDRDPLLLGATAERVYINGEEAHNNDKTFVPRTPSNVATAATLAGPSFSSPTQLANGYAIIGADVYVSASEPKLSAATIVVDGNGIVSCISAVGACTVPDVTFSMPGGIVLPGLVDAGSGIGTLEIDSEESTQDGSTDGADASGTYAALHARDGIRLHTRHVQAAWRAGVTVSVARPMGSQLLGGESVAFYTCGKCSNILDNVMIKETVALHMAVGNSAKDSGESDSVSGQFDAVYRLFESVQTSIAAIGVNETEFMTLDRAHRPIARVLRKQQPVVVAVHQSDAIASLLRLQKKFGFKLVILGGAESHMLANDLAAAVPAVSVLLEARTPTHDFDTNDATIDAIKILTDAGVMVGLYVGDPDNGRNLRWEAGFAMNVGLTFEQALATVTTNVADMFGVPNVGRIEVGQRASLVLYDGQEPFSLRTRPAVVATGDIVQTKPQQR
jgi:imidazolonepropionase-like amidohydrolase